MLELHCADLCSISLLGGGTWSYLPFPRCPPIFILAPIIESRAGLVGAAVSGDAVTASDGDSLDWDCVPWSGLCRWGPPWNMESKAIVSVMTKGLLHSGGRPILAESIVDRIVLACDNDSRTLELKLARRPKNGWIITSTPREKRLQYPDKG